MELANKIHLYANFLQVHQRGRLLIFFHRKSEVMNLDYAQSWKNPGKQMISRLKKKALKREAGEKTGILVFSR